MKEPKCKIMRPVKRSTLEKQSCKYLWDKLKCFAGTHKVKVEDRTYDQPYMPYYPNDPSSDTPLGRTFTNVLEVMDKRVCMEETVIEMAKKNLRKAFPKHRFVASRNIIEIPKNFTKDEIEHLQKDVKEITLKAYKIKYRKRLNQYYLSPNPSGE